MRRNVSMRRSESLDNGENSLATDGTQIKHRWGRARSEIGAPHRMNRCRTLREKRQNTFFAGRAYSTLRDQPADQSARRDVESIIRGRTLGRCNQDLPSFAIEPAIRQQQIQPPGIALHQAHGMLRDRTQQARRVQLLAEIETDLMQGGQGRYALPLCFKQ